MCKVQGVYRQGHHRTIKNILKEMLRTNEGDKKGVLTKVDLGTYNFPIPSVAELYRSVDCTKSSQ